MNFPDFDERSVNELVESKTFETEDEALKILGIDLPLLAKHFDLHILRDLRKGSEWLAWLEDDPATHWDKLRERFLEDSLKCLDTMDSFKTPLRCEIINNLMITSKVGLFYALAMFDINRMFNNMNVATSKTTG